MSQKNLFVQCHLYIIDKCLTLSIKNKYKWLKVTKLSYREVLLLILEAIRDCVMTELILSLVASFCTPCSRSKFVILTSQLNVFCQFCR